ncbi:MAG: alpha-L-fucosidase [Rikenellaceae bacterium]
MKRAILSLILLLSLFAVEAKKPEKFEPTWESLKSYEVPEWWKNSKFGIYFHWGPYTVPAFDTEWYSHWMYLDKMKHAQYHKMVYGTTDKFGYKDFIPLFKGEKFDADEWAKLFKEAGAQFAGPCAEHADGFAMWDSDLTEWDSYDMGPNVDVVAEMQRAIKKQGMKYIITYHRQWLYAWFPTWNKDTDAGDPAYAGLYGPYVKDGMFNIEGVRNHIADHTAEDAFNKEWYDRLIELINKYDPDLVWFDNKLSIIDEKYRRQFLADYYNKGIERGKEVVCTYKFQDMMEGTAVLDLERARMSEKKDFNWLTDDSIDWGAWCDVQNPDYKTTNRLLDFLIDVVSKNGAVLLSVTPNASGVMPHGVQQRLREMGAWLKLNGEAIYDTRPWVIYGEGPQEIVEGHLKEHLTADAVAEDIRFTTNGDQLYATALDWPESGKLVIKSLAMTQNYLQEPVKKVSMLGSKEKLEWRQTAHGLEVTFPSVKPCEHAFVLKIN